MKANDFSLFANIIINCRKCPLICQISINNVTIVVNPNQNPSVALSLVSAFFTFIITKSSCLFLVSPPKCFFLSTWLRLPVQVWTFQSCTLLVLLLSGNLPLSSIPISNSDLTCHVPFSSTQVCGCLSHTPQPGGSWFLFGRCALSDSLPLWFYASFKNQDIRLTVCSF